MLANAAFCSSLQGHVLPLHSSGHAPPAVQDEAEALDSPTSLRTRIDVVERGRISGTQKVGLLSAPIRLIPMSLI